MTVVASANDIRQRLNADGLATLGLAGPLLSQFWVQSMPTLNVGTLDFTIATGVPWYAPLAGMMVPIANGRQLGLTGLDGTPAAAANEACVVLKVHPQARLRLERQFVSVLPAPAGGPVDRSLRPVPATILIRNPVPPLTLAQQVVAGESAMPAGIVTMYDEHGLIIDLFAFAAAVAAVLTATPALTASMPAGEPPAGAPTLQQIAGQAGQGNFVHVVDLHGRPWTDPPNPPGGISFYTFPGGAPTQGAHIGDGLLHPWPPPGGGPPSLLCGDGDPANTQTTSSRIRFGFSTIGTLGTAPLSWPAPGPQTQVPVRDTLRVTAVDPTFHLLGNRTDTGRDNVPGADDVTVAEPAPQVRQGSPAVLLPDGRSVLGFFQSVINGLGLGFTSGPILAATVDYDDGLWPLPAAAGPAGAWPAAALPAVPPATPPAATPVSGTVATVLSALAALRTGAAATWVGGSNDVLVTLPAGLPVGVAIRLYPIKVLLGTSPDEQPLLWRADGAATIIGPGTPPGPSTSTTPLVLTDPFDFGPDPKPQRPPATLRADAVVTWLPAAGGPPQVKMIANLEWDVVPVVPEPTPTPGAANLLSWDYWRGAARNPMLGASELGSFDLSDVGADPGAVLLSVVRQLTTVNNPRDAPRLPTMVRTESLLAIQLAQAPGVTDLYRSVLTGGWLARECDSHSYRLGNPGAAGEHEVHAPGMAATSELGFDLWVAAAHRAGPVVPTAIFADPVAGLASNWLGLQANPASAPPGPATGLPPAMPPATSLTIGGAVLQTVPAAVETPELTLVPDDEIDDVESWIQNRLGTTVPTPNGPELRRQIIREVRSSKFGRRDAQWALRRAIRHARELVYIETPLFGATAHGESTPEAVDLVAELVARLNAEPRLRVVILVSRDTPFVAGYEPWSMCFYQTRRDAASALQGAGGTVDGPFGPRPRVVIAHPVGVPGRPLVIRTTTVIVDDVWCLTGTSSWTRRGLTFDGATDVVLADWALDRGAGTAIRAHRKTLMAAHLGVGPAPVGGGVPASPVGAPAADWVRLHQPLSAHEAFADLLVAGGRGKLLPLWDGPDPQGVASHSVAIADPDGRDGASVLGVIAAALSGNGKV